MSRLNEPGAPAQGDMIPLCVPQVDGKEWQYVKECLDTGWVSSAGSYVDRLESLLAGHCKSPTAVATSSGTAALHLALQVAGVQAGDEVVTSDLTFIAPVNAIRYLNAQPVLVDCDPYSWQMEVELIRNFLTQDCYLEHGRLRNRLSGRRIGALMPVHILGHPVDLDPLLELAEQFGLPLIEDATESLGATYKDRVVGSDGTLACFSFNGNKIITSGGGGVLVGKNQQWLERARHLSTQAKVDPVHYVHDEVGYNYRLGNVQAAIAVAQFERLDEFVTKKRAIARRYRDGLRNIKSLSLMDQQPWAYSTFWMYTVLLERSNNRNDLMDLLGRNKIQTRPLWWPAHRNEPFTDCRLLSRQPDRPHSLALAQTSISLPCSVGLTREDQDRVIDLLRQLLK